MSLGPSSGGQTAHELQCGLPPPAPVEAQDHNSDSHRDIYEDFSVNSRSAKTKPSRSTISPTESAIGL